MQSQSVLVSVDHTTTLGLNSGKSAARLLLPETTLLPSLFPGTSPGYQPAKTTMKPRAFFQVGFSPCRSSGHRRKEPLKSWHQAQTWAVQVAPLQHRLGINTLRDRHISAEEAAGCSHLAAFPPASFCQFWPHTCNLVRCQQKAST